MQTQEKLEVCAHNSGIIILVQFQVQLLPVAVD